MRARRVRKAGDRKPADEALRRRAHSFFSNLRRSERGRKLLSEQNHRIEFDLRESGPFHVRIWNGRVSVRQGAAVPRRFNLPDLIHFELSWKTLELLLEGKIRFTDALIPSDPQGANSMLLLECTLFKWSVLNWVGRLFREAQLLAKA
jgi:hypothetical protein